MRDYGTVQFGPQYHVGIAQVDQEHQQLFAIVGRIQAALEQDSDTAQAQARQAVARAVQLGGARLPLYLELQRKLGPAKPGTRID